MMKLNKKIIPVLCIILAVSVACCACGKDKSEQAETDSKMVSNQSRDTDSRSAEKKNAGEQKNSEDKAASGKKKEKKDKASDQKSSDSHAAGDVLKNSMDSHQTGGTWAAVYYGLNTHEEAEYNNGRMQAASLIKLFIYGCVYENLEAVKSGDSYDGETDSLLNSMITVSDNNAANTLVSKLGSGDSSEGMAMVNEYCMNHGYSFTHMGRLLLAPADADDNYTSPGDCADFLRSVYFGEISGSDKLQEALKNQTRAGKIPAGIPSGVTAGNKTGELGDVENDAAIIWSGDNPYVLCIMSEELPDTAAARNAIQEVSSDVFNAESR